MSPVPENARGFKPAIRLGQPDNAAPEVVADVIVVGAGAGGLAAANSAAVRGLDVVVLEAAEEPGGTMKKSAGGFLVHDNPFAEERGYFEDRELTLRLMVRVSFPDQFDPDAERYGIAERDFELMTTFYDRSNEIVQALADDGVLTLTVNPSTADDPRGLPSYYTQLEEETVYFGRTLGPLGPDGFPGFGRELARQLLAGAERKGVRVLCDRRVDEILREDGEVTGVTTANGQRFLARQGVIFATGGFAQNVALRDELLPGLVMGSCAVPTAQGDLLKLTEDLDVELDHLQCAWWGEVPAEPCIDNPEVVALLFYPYGDSMIQVNRHGRRVVNEKAVYDQRAPVHFVVDETGDQPNRILLTIYDTGVAHDHHDLARTRWPVPPVGTTEPWVIEAPTLEELEQAVRGRLDAIKEHTDGCQLSDGFLDELKQTIKTFNHYATTGVDEEFHRGEEPVQVDGSGPPRPGCHPNPTMYPINAQGPYFCIITAAGTLDTKGGPRINTQGQIMRKDGTPVPRLYGAGNCVASASANGYWAGGNTIGLAMIYGYIAGEHIATLPACSAVGEAVATA